MVLDSQGLYWFEVDELSFMLKGSVLLGMARSKTSSVKDGNAEDKI